MRTILLLSVALLVSAAVLVNGDTVFNAYFTNWSQYRRCTEYKFKPPNITPDIANKLTHVSYAFAKFDRSWNALPVEWDDCNSTSYLGSSICQCWSNCLYDEMRDLKTNYTHLKTLISFGGWNFGSRDFSDMASTAASRAKFINSSMHFARYFGFDGIDIDWEYPNSEGRWVYKDYTKKWDAGGRPSDTVNYTFLLKEFRAAITKEAETGNFSSPLLLTIAAPAAHNRSRFLQLDEISKYVDWMNIMSYDYNGAWQNITGVNAPLVNPPVSSALPQWSATQSVTDYFNAGVPADKITLGLATYGHTWNVWSNQSAFDVGCAAQPHPQWEYCPGLAPLDCPPYASQDTAGSCTDAPGILAYYEIASWMDQGATASWDDQSSTPYYYKKSSSQWLTFDNEKSLAAKVDNIVNNKNLRGVMLWALDLDDFPNGYPLMNAAYNALKKSDDTRSPKITVNPGQ